MAIVIMLADSCQQCIWQLPTNCLAVAKQSENQLFSIIKYSFFKYQIHFLQVSDTPFFILASAFFH